MAVVTGSGRVLAVDHGETRVGLALSDEGRRLSSPLVTLRNRGTRSIVAAVAEQVRTHGAVWVVVGDPVSLDGTVGERARRVRAFARRLAAALARESPPVPVFLWDESGSTEFATRLIHERGHTIRKARRRGALDRIAAARVLQEFLDAGCPAVDRVTPDSTADSQPHSSSSPLPAPGLAGPARSPAGEEPRP